MSEVFKNLQKVEKELQAKFLIQAARTSVNRLARSARQKVKPITGALRKAIRTKVKVYKNGSVLYGVVGINTLYSMKVPGRKKELIPNTYAKKIEMRTGFMRRTWEENKRSIQPEFEKLIKKKIDKVLPKR